MNTTRKLPAPEIDYFLLCQGCNLTHEVEGEEFSSVHDADDPDTAKEKWRCDDCALDRPRRVFILSRVRDECCNCGKEAAMYKVAGGIYDVPGDYCGDCADEQITTLVEMEEAVAADQCEGEKK